MHTPERKSQADPQWFESEKGSEITAALFLIEGPEMELEVAEVHGQVLESRGAAEFLQNAAEHVTDVPDPDEKLETMAAVAAAFIVAGRLVGRNGGTNA